MRKIVKHPEGVRLEAIVEKDGIGFIPTKSAGPASISFDGRFATIEEETGEVKCKTISNNPNDEDFVKCEMDEKIKKHGSRALFISVSGIVVALVMMFVSIALPYTDIWVNVFATILYLMMLVLVLPQAFAILVGRIFGNKEMVNFSKYLGAKNAVENAYYDLGRVPNVEEVKEYSLYSSEDGYTKRSYIAALWFIISFVRFLDGWAYWLVTICAILVLCWLDWNNKLSFIQSMVVSKPEENHYKVAIAALEDVADLLDHVEVHFHTVELSPDPENFEEEHCSGCPAYDFCKEESQKMAKEKGDNVSE